MVIIITIQRPLYSYDSVTTAILPLPLQLRKEIYNQIKDTSLAYGTLNLIIFERWLDSQLNIYFNPLLNEHQVIVRKQFNKEAKEQSGKKNKKDDQIGIIPQRIIKFWLHHRSHRLLNCLNVLKKSLEEREEFFKTNNMKTVYRR